MKAYIVTSGEYSDYRINAVFLFTLYSDKGNFIKSGPTFYHTADW
jgi:hypothetical protein